MPWASRRAWEEYSPVWENSVKVTVHSTTWPGSHSRGRAEETRRVKGPGSSGRTSPSSAGAARSTWSSR